MASWERVTVGALSVLGGTFWLVMNLSVDALTVWSYAGLLVAVVIGRFLRKRQITGEILGS